MRFGLDIHLARTGHGTDKGQFIAGRQKRDNKIAASNQAPSKARYLRQRCQTEADRQARRTWEDKEEDKEAN
jgi:hypothetical protein